MRKTILLAALNTLADFVSGAIAASPPKAPKRLLLPQLRLIKLKSSVGRLKMLMQWQRALSLSKGRGRKPL